jgi:ribosomal protein S18 acetylase RimI-like enzyme
VITYRRFRNTDPPALADVWNESLTGRGSYPLPTPSQFERWVFSKPYFDHDGLILAVDDASNRVLGFALAGFGPTEDLSALDKTQGVVCVVVVRPGERRKGIGRELVRRAEAYLTAGGATTLRVGPAWPNCPFGFGLYGGTDAPGFLASDAGADPFVKALGYAPAEQTLVYQKRLDQPLTIADARFGVLRRRYDTQVHRAAEVPSWWHDCVWGTLEPVEFRLMDKLTNLPAAEVTVWELEGYGWRWGFPAAGVLDIHVREDLRRQGLAKMLMSSVLRFVQDQFFGIVEVHARADRPDAVALCKSVGLDQVDVGTAYVKKA